MSTEVLEKDKGVENAEAIHSYKSMEELKQAIDGDTTLRNELVTNPERFKVAEESEEPSPEAIPQGELKPEAQPEVKPEAKPKKTVSLEVEDDELGTYIVGREIDAAIHEALKGNKEKDKTIDFLKNEKLPSLQSELERARSESQSLKKQIAEFEAKKLEQAAKPKPKVERPVIPELGDDEDILDEKTQPKIRAALKSLKQVNGYVENLEGEIGELKATIAEIKEKPVEIGSSAKEQAAAEFEEIDRFAVRHADKLGKGRKFEEMQQDYLGFMENLRLVGGVTAPLLDGKGGFSPEVNRQYQLFHEDSDAGKAFRAKCAERNIALPEDFELLTRLYQIRQCRNNHFERGSDGNPVPISYEKALPIYEAEAGVITPKKPTEAKPTTEQQLSELERKQKAAAIVAEKTRNELPAGEGGGDVDIDNYPTSKFLAQMEKLVETWTPFEINLFKKVARVKKVKGDQTEDWIKSHLGPRYNE